MCYYLCLEVNWYYGRPDSYDLLISFWAFMHLICNSSLFYMFESSLKAHFIPCPPWYLLEPGSWQIPGRGYPVYPGVHAKVLSPCRQGFQERKLNEGHNQAHTCFSYLRDCGSISWAGTIRASLHNIVRSCQIQTHTHTRKSQGKNPNLPQLGSILEDET